MTREQTAETRLALPIDSDVIVASYVVATPAAHDAVCSPSPATTMATASVELTEAADARSSDIRGDDAAAIVTTRGAEGHTAAEGGVSGGGAGGLVGARWEHLPVVVQIIVEAYHPVIAWAKLVPVLRMRCFKVLGMIINQKTGQLLLGWNGKENRLYDRVGHDVDDLFLKLYGHPLRQPDVFRFLRRRLQYALITGVVTGLQILLTWQRQVAWALALSVLVAPVTLLDRQWSTNVTKQPPRFAREVALNHLSFPVGAILGASNEPRYKPPPRVRLKLHFMLLQWLEMFNGFLQFLSGLALFFLPGLFLLRKDLPQLDLGHGVTFIVALNIVRGAKELTNWLSAALEWVLTPVKYQQARDTLIAFLASLLVFGPQELFTLLARHRLNGKHRMDEDAAVLDAAAVKKRKQLNLVQDMIESNVAKFGRFVIRPTVSLVEGSEEEKKGGGSATTGSDNGASGPGVAHHAEREASPTGRTAVRVRVQGGARYDDLPHYLRCPMSDEESARMCALFDAVLVKESVQFVGKHNNE